MATVVARSTPTVSAVASFSSQHVSRQTSVSRTEEGKREGFWSSQGCWQRFPPTGATPQRNGTVISCSSETTRSNVSRSSGRGSPIQSRQTQARARHFGRRRRYVPCCPGSSLEGRVPSTRTRVRAHPIDQEFCRTETKASGTGQASNRESTSKFGHGLSEGGGKFARRGRTKARRVDDGGEGSSVSIPSHSRLQSQRGVRSIEVRDRQIATVAGCPSRCCGSQSHPRGTPRIGILDESPSRGSSCRDRGKQRSEKVATDYVVGRRATATSFVGGRRCCFRGRFLCDGTWRGTVRTLLREERTPRCIARYGHRGTRVGEAAHPGPTRRSMDATLTTEASNPESVHRELLDCLQEDLLVPGSRRRVRRRIRDSDSEDVFVGDGERTTPRRRLVLVSSTQVDPVPPTVFDSVDSPSRRRRRVPHSEAHRGHPTVEEGAIYHDLTLIDSSDDDAPLPSQDRQHPHQLFDTRTASRHSLPKSSMSQGFLRHLVFRRFSTRQVSRTQTAPSTLRFAVTVAKKVTMTPAAILN